jgi:hypothetical protein
LQGSLNICSERLGRSLRMLSGSQDLFGNIGRGVIQTQFR